MGLPETYEDEDECDRLSLLLVYQVICLACLAASGIIVWITELVSPDFFQFPYLSPATLEKVLHFWPLLAYGALMASLSSIGIVSSPKDQKVLALNVTTSVLAGVWEELGFRCLFVCTAMLGLAWSNWLFSVGAGLVFVIVLIGVGAFLILCGFESQSALSKVGHIAGGVVVIVLGVAGGWLYFQHTVDPVYWMYDWIVVPVVNIITLGQFRDVLYGDYPRLFVFGMIVANAKFRDGHKYQGWFGMLNAWIGGFVFMYATLTYGLWTAVCVHVVYDLEFAFIRFAVRKLKK